VNSFSEYKRRIDSGEPGFDVDTSVPKDARPYQGHRAGFISRALAALIDLGSVIALVFTVNLVVALIRLIIERVQGATLPQFGWSVALVFFLLLLAW
jgi:heme/copper-type cytochrome/quinol oxidase subunit 1